MSTSTQVHDAAAHVRAASGDAVGWVLNNFLRAFIGWPFAIDAVEFPGFSGQTLASGFEGCPVRSRDWASREIPARRFAQGWRGAA